MTRAALVDVEGGLGAQEHLGVARDGTDQFADRLAFLADNLQKMQCRQLAVAGGHLIHEDDMTRLLATQGHALSLHHLQHIAVTNRSAEQLQAAGLAVAVQPQIGHDRADKASTRQPSLRLEVFCTDSHHLVPVDLFSLLIDDQAAIRVAVERHANVIAAGCNFLAQLL